MNETSGSYQLVVCPECGVTFTRNPDYAAERYVAAYQGTGCAAAVPRDKAFVYSAPARRLELETLAFFTPPPRLTPAQRLALRWLKDHAPAGAAVVDCGCGSGLFLRGLQRMGLSGLGVEVSEALVELLKRRGLQAITGEAPAFPWDGDDPFAITFFDVLEHFPDPSRIIRALQKRFPRAHILASVPSPTRAELLLRGNRGFSDLPPNHFMRWTPRALALFFRREGYERTRVFVPPPIGSELFRGLGQIGARSGRLEVGVPLSGESVSGRRRPLARRISATAILLFQKGYHVATDLCGGLEARRAARRGASASSMLVVAERCSS